MRSAKYPGVFITFEGPDGSGKSTQLQLAAAECSRRGLPLLLTREPGGTPLAEKLREILKTHNGPETLHFETELLLMEAARSQHVQEKILPALKEGKVVLCDRFFDSTSAYQGAAREMDMEFIHTLNSFASCALKPDRTLLFDVDSATGLGRTRKRDEEFDRFDTEDLHFHQKVREGFLSLARREPERFRIIDASRSKEEVFSQVMEVLNELLF